MSKKLFDFAIGNPPYNQEFSKDGNKTYASPIYHEFLDAAYSVADKVELIHPARCLFNAGSTPKAWNEKILQDPHFKVLRYEEDATKIFANTDIKGGIAITYHDDESDYGAIQVFTKYPELNAVLKKARPIDDSDSLMSVIYIQNRFNLGALLSDYPEYKSAIGSNGKDSRFEENIFVKIPLFIEKEVADDEVRTLGIYKNKRSWRNISKKYVDMVHENLEKYKVVVPVANGTGKFGQTLSTPVLEQPFEAYTRSFIGIGAFNTKFEAEAALKYIKTKFARTMLSILKVTQMTNKDVWKYVPLQDFTELSDINWKKSIHEVDIQLYRKYKLNKEEITFIETNVKEME